MLLKVIKHEIKFSYKDFLILFGVVNGAFLLANIFAFSSGVISWLIILVLFGIAGGLIYLIILLYRFLANSIFTSRGYFTLTLPVKTSTLILGKLIVGMSWLMLFWISLLFQNALLFTRYYDIINILADFLFSDFFTFYLIVMNYFSGALFLLTVLLFSISVFYTFKSRSFKVLKIIGIATAIYAFAAILIAQIPPIFDYSLGEFGDHLSYIVYLSGSIGLFFAIIHLVDKRIDLI